MEEEEKKIFFKKHDVCRPPRGDKVEQLTGKAKRQNNKTIFSCCFPPLCLDTHRAVAITMLLCCTEVVDTAAGSVQCVVQKEQPFQPCKSPSCAPNVRATRFHFARRIHTFARVGPYLQCGSRDCLYFLLQSSFLAPYFCT